jgi:uncharacterized protein YecE (DUF72 family)
LGTVYLPHSGIIATTPPSVLPIGLTGMKLYVGTSGYSYKEWKGKFYPDDLPEKEMLRFYSRTFNSVEINNTFYRMPKPAVLESWAAEVPADFKFVIKASQKITHFSRLKEESADSVRYLLDVTRVLHERLGPILFQTAANLPKDIPRLERFLQFIPKEQRATFEFRNSSWFVPETFDLLRSHNVALCIAEAEEEVPTPFEPTADWGYLRLRRPGYSEEDLKQWAQRIRATSWNNVFIFFKHEDEALGPALAQQFNQLWKMS